MKSTKVLLPGESRLRFASVIALCDNSNVGDRSATGRALDRLPGSVDRDPAGHPRMQRAVVVVNACRRELEREAGACVGRDLSRGPGAALVCVVRRNVVSNRVIVHPRHGAATGKDDAARAERARSHVNRARRRVVLERARVIVTTGQQSAESKDYPAQLVFHSRLLALRNTWSSSGRSFMKLSRTRPSLSSDTVAGIALAVTYQPAGSTIAFAGRPNPRSQTSSPSCNV